MFRVIRDAFTLTLPCLIMSACQLVHEHETPAGSARTAEELGVAAFAQAIPGRWMPSPEAVAAGERADVPITEAGPWRGESSCSGTFTVGAQALEGWLRDHWPQVSGVGGYSCRPINGNSAVTSIHAVGRAVDIFIPLDGGEADNGLGDSLANYLMVHATEMGIQRVIWDLTVWSAGGVPRAYGGEHPHHDHLHVELSVPASMEQTPFFMNGLPAPERGPCAPPIVAEGGVIDSESPCLGLYGPSRYWRSVGGEGYGGSLYWTNAYVGERASNWAQWRFSLAQSGRYRIESHSVAAYSLHPQVRYQLKGGGDPQTFQVSIGGREGWVEVGEADLIAGREYQVELFDHYSSAGEGQHIIVDALRVTPLSAASPPPIDRGAPLPPQDQGLPSDQGLPTSGDRSPSPHLDQGTSPPSGLFDRAFSSTDPDFMMTVSDERPRPADGVNCSTHHLEDRGLLPLLGFLLSTFIWRRRRVPRVS